MSESTFPFEGAEEPESGPRDRKKMALVAGAGALAVAVLGYFVVVPMFSGGGSSPDALVVHHSAPKTTKKAAAKPAAAKPAVQPATYSDVSARQDPFKPLVVEPVAAPPVAVDPATGQPVTGTTGGTTSTGTTSTGGSSASVGGQRVALLHVYSKDGKVYAQTKVGDTVYTPVVGDVFAGTYKLLATGTKSATYLFGDEQFQLAEGQEVLK
jgi:hypothetical protein